MKIIKLLNKKFYEEIKNKTTFYYEKSGYSEVFGLTATRKSGWEIIINIAGKLSADKPVSKEWRYKSSYRNSQSSKYWKFNKKKVDIVAVLHDINLAIRYADYIIILINAGKLYDSGEAKKEEDWFSIFFLGK